MQEPKPLCRKLHPNVTDPSGVAAWPIEAGNKTDFHGIGTNDEDNRDRGGRRLGRERGCSANRCNDDIHAPANQFGRQRRQALVVTVGPAILNRDIPTFDVSGFAQPLAECGDKMRKGCSRCAVEKANDRHRQLLRLRPQRPRRRAAEERDEFASSHCGYFFTVSRNFIQAAIPARADFSSTPSGNPATPTPPTSWPSTASGTPPPTR